MGTTTSSPASPPAPPPSHTLTAMPLAEFTISATPGAASIVVDGKPIEGATAARLDIGADQIPQLTIVVSSEGTVSGEGNVTIRPDGAPHDFVAIADYVRNVDPSDVRDRMGEASMADDPVAVMLDALADLLESTEA